jgi:hypothetical protein
VYKGGSDTIMGAELLGSPVILLVCVTVLNGMVVGMMVANNHGLLLCSTTQHQTLDLLSMKQEY